MEYYCNDCEEDISFNVYSFSKQKFGRALCMDCQKEKAPKITSKARLLFNALKKKGIKCTLEGDDGYKSVDIVIEWANLHIEVDGHQHMINSKQLYTDLLRQEYSSEDGFQTLRVTNQQIEQVGVDKIADSIAQVARKRLQSYNR